MKAISLWNPWALLMAHEAKRYETRSWPFRGNLPCVMAIHATASIPRQVIHLIHHPTEGLVFRLALKEMGLSVSDMPKAAVVAVARLVKVVLTTEIVDQLSDRERAFGDYGPGRFAWVFDKVLRLEKPIPAKGRQQVWEWDAPAELVEWERITLAEKAEVVRG